jgi:hypothetical protein
MERQLQNKVEDDDDDNDYIDVKCVIKELLFNGANRSFLGKFNLSLLDQEMTAEYQYLTPLELLNSFEKKLPPS